MKVRSRLNALAMFVVISAALIGCTPPREGASCSTLPQGWTEQTNMPAGTYFWTNAGQASNGHDAFVMMGEDGAVWATDIDPSVIPSRGGLLVPLNEKARQDSDAGADLSDATIRRLFPSADPAAAADMLAGC